MSTYALNTATLIVRLPESAELPPGPLRNKSSLLETLLSALRNFHLEFIYCGQGLPIYPATETGTTFVINVLQADPRLFDETVSREKLLKRFEKEVRYANGHIIIDSGGNARRLIEIYINNRTTYS